MTARRPVRLQDLKHCIVCSGKLVWPSLHFCGPGCSEEWVRLAREREEPVLAPKGKR